MNNKLSLTFKDTLSLNDKHSLTHSGSRQKKDREKIKKKMYFGKIKSTRCEKREKKDREKIKK